MAMGKTFRQDNIFFIAGYVRHIDKYLINAAVIDAQHQFHLLIT